MRSFVTKMGKSVTKMNKVYYEIDENTGELKPTEDIIVALQEGDVVRRKKQIEYYNMNCCARNDNGNFVWLLFRYGENLFPNISAANLTRLMYAATFCEDDGSIMKKSDLRKRMNLNRTRWSEFWNEMITNDILYEEEDIVFINPTFVIKGKIDTADNYTRLFCEYVQQLYESCSSVSAHKQLSYIFKIIPFINRRTNIVCVNPMEQNDKNIRAMRLGDFCDVIGYDKNNARRLAGELLKIRINGELAIGFFVTDLDEKTWRIVVNPKLYFGGKYDLLFQQYRELFIKEAEEYKRLTTGVQN